MSILIKRNCCLRLGIGDLRRLSADSPSLVVSDRDNEEESTNMQSTMTTSTSRRRYGHSRLSIPGSLAGLPLRSCCGCRNASCSSLDASIVALHAFFSLTRVYSESNGRRGSNRKGVVTALNCFSASHAVCEHLRRRPDLVTRRRGGHSSFHAPSGVAVIVHSIRRGVLRRLLG